MNHAKGSEDFHVRTTLFGIGFLKHFAAYLSREPPSSQNTPQQATADPQLEARFYPALDFLDCPTNSGRLCSTGVLFSTVWTICATCSREKGGCDRRFDDSLAPQDLCDNSDGPNSTPYHRCVQALWPTAWHWSDHWRSCTAPASALAFVDVSNSIASCNKSAFVWPHLAVSKYTMPASVL